MSEVVIYCAWCSEHKYRVEESTVRDAGFMTLQCPKCEKITTIGFGSGGGPLHVIAGVPKKGGQKD